MDVRLVAWARAVKARQRAARERMGLPPLWLFSDPERMPDLVAVVSRLPKELCGVVFRHDGVPDRAGLLRRVAAVCRDRRLVLVVAGSGPVPARAGRHLREGRGRVGRGVSTSSAHGRAGVIRARRAGVSLVFLSPVFPTRSHPDAAALGVVRWGLTVRGSGVAVAALGGVDGRSIRQLIERTRHIGAIGALV